MNKSDSIAEPQVRPGSKGQHQRHPANQTVKARQGEQGLSQPWRQWAQAVSMQQAVCSKRCLTARKLQ